MGYNDAIAEKIDGQFDIHVHYTFKARMISNNAKDGVIIDIMPDRDVPMGSYMPAFRIVTTDWAKVMYFVSRNAAGAYNQMLKKQAEKVEQMWNINAKLEYLRKEFGLDGHL